ncbi:MAG: methylated-DNA--[protein]-cysteine S-methyltransferase [Solirubrobacteraceae bacterium]
MIDLESQLRAAADQAAEGPLPELPELLDIAQAADGAGLLDVAYALTDSPLGQLLLASTPRGIVRISYLDAGDDVEETLRKLAARISPRILRAPRKLDEPRRELDEFFAGARRAFDLPVDLRLAGPGFRRRVLAATARIPFGDSRSYKQVASAAGSPNAFRAAGTALGSNPLPIVIPCHRVRHAGGGIGGYTGGLERKRKLLAIEGGQR